MKKLGFTLIELLVVIAIAGIILAIGTPSYITTMKQSRDTRRKTDIEQIRLALETYRAENGAYPADATLLVSDYMASLPTDPKNGTYTYTFLTATTYTLCASLETIATPATCNWIVTSP